MVRGVSENMKIVLLQDDFPPYAKGGAGIVAASFAQELVAHGHELTVITAVQDHTQAGSFREDGMSIERIYSDYPQRWRSWRSLYNPATVPAIKRILAEIKPEIVHAHNVHYHLSYWALRLARKSGSRVFLTTHDVMLFHYGKLHSFIDPKHSECRSTWDYRVNARQQLQEYRFWYNPFRNLIIKQLLKNVDKIFAVSSALRDALFQNGISNVEVIHNGINVEMWRMSPELTQEFIQKHRLEGKKIILFGGRISGLKGGEVMLAALRDILPVEPQAVLLLLGTRDPYVEKLERQAALWGMGDHLVSTGWLSGDELRAVYNAAALVVVPSLYLDPLPTVVLEAMACGKSVVGSCFGGIPEMILDGETGFTVNPYNQQILADRIIKLLANKEERYVFGLAGRRRVEERFSLRGWCKETLAAYTKL